MKLPVFLFPHSEDRAVRESGGTFFQSGVALRLPPQSKFAGCGAEPVQRSAAPRLGQFFARQVAGKCFPLPSRLQP